MGDKYKVKDDGSIVPANLAADPANPDEGQFYFNTTVKLMKVYNGTTWQTIDTDSQTLQQVTTQGNITTDDIILNGTAKLDLSQTSSATVIPVKFYEQAGEPTLSDGDVAWWFKTDTSQMYYITRRSGVQFKVEAS